MTPFSTPILCFPNAHMLYMYIPNFSSQPNIRYIGLEAMSRLARLEGSDVIKSHKETVMISLKDADISIKRRALDLLFFMR